MGGGVVLYAATFDRRVRAVVAQVPWAMNCESSRRRDPERFDRIGQKLAQERIDRYRTGIIGYHKMVAPPGEPCTLPQPGAYEAIMRATRNSPLWRNQISDESGEKVREFDPVSLIHLISPTPLLMISGEHDNIVPLTVVMEAYERAGEPKEMSVLPCSHFEIYEQPWLDRSAGAATGWFVRYLVPAAPTT